MSTRQANMVKAWAGKVIAHIESPMTNATPDILVAMREDAGNIKGDAERETVLAVLDLADAHFAKGGDA